MEHSFEAFVAADGAVPGSGFNGVGSDIWTAHRPGRYVVALGGGMCPPSGFTQDYGRGCMGGFAMPAAILVQVVAH
ncbi:hypothetical protein [Nocardioides ultimimeridianus]